MPCRVKRRQLWSHRILLEQAKHEFSSFVTLTYSDENLPPGGSLLVKDAQDWLKRLRRSVEPLKIRYFLVGEYGDETQRPHYHAALFGLPGCVFGYRIRALRTRCKCPSCDRIRSTWSKGGTDCAFLEPESAQYIAGYTTKKMTNKHDPYVIEWLNGRAPEFARMSLKPGIGAAAMEDVADLLTSDSGIIALENGNDVPFALQHGKKLKPLGRYLRNVLRKTLGSEKAFKAAGERAQALRLWQELQKDKALAKKEGKHVGEFREDRRLQKVLQVEHRLKIYSKKEGIS